MMMRKDMGGCGRGQGCMCGHHCGELQEGVNVALYKRPVAEGG